MPLVQVLLVLRGAGLGLSLRPAMTAAYASVRPGELGDATALANIAMRVGGAVGAALCVIVLSRALDATGPSVGFASAFLALALICLLARWQPHGCAAASSDNTKPPPASKGRQTDETATASTDLHLAVIIGSVRGGRFGPRVGARVQKCLAESAINADIIDLADLTFPPTMGEHLDVASFATRISRADAILVVAPEYNHSYLGPLKTAIDALREQWQAKPVAFVSYGGMAGGLRAVEALRAVFAELHAVTIRNTVSLHNPWAPAADPDIDYPDTAATQALAQMMRQLLWWADALRAARQHVPYPA